MEKKKYEKPIVLDLNGNTASGGPLACMSGSSVSSLVCYDGTGRYQYSADCFPGSTADIFNAACIAGGTADYECAAGNYGTRRDGCVAGAHNY